MKKTNKIVRTICFFDNFPTEETIKKIDGISEILAKNNFLIQTKRLCSASIEKIKKLDSLYANKGYIFSAGSLEEKTLLSNFDDLLKCQNTHWNLDLTNRLIDIRDVGILFEIIKKKPDKTFNFTYIFGNCSSTPFFPSASYLKNGFSIGLQPTDLSVGCTSLDQWLNKMEEVWLELIGLFKDNPQFLGIDSSIAPLVSGEGSLVGFINRLGLDFSHTATTDFYLKISRFIKEKNPKSAGLCGLMFPCLEDSKLAEEYEKGNFTIERNIYLSLHSGLGVDTYPIGTDEKPARILEILKLLQGLSEKYKKPLSARFVSDGKTKIGEKSNFQNQYLQDVVVRRL